MMGAITSMLVLLLALLCTSCFSDLGNGEGLSSLTPLLSQVEFNLSKWRDTLPSITSTTDALAGGNGSKDIGIGSQTEEIADGPNPMYPESEEERAPGYDNITWSNLENYELLEMLGTLF